MFVHVRRPSAISATASCRLTLISMRGFRFRWEPTVRFRSIYWKTRKKSNTTCVYSGPRATFAPEEHDESALARRSFACATTSGAASIGFDGGTLEPGAPADFFTVDLNDPAIAGSSPENLLASVVFSLSRTAIKDVVVAGERIVADGRHAQQDGIRSAVYRVAKTTVTQTVS